MSSPLLHCQNLSKAYGADPLFEDISLSIFKGDRLGIIGPNGSGKSTLLRVLCGEESPDQGEVIRRKHLQTGYVEQKHQFSSDQSILEILLDILKKDSRCVDPETQAQVALGRLGFTDFTQKAGDLSGGWQKRLGIACELVKDPELLVLDEPTNHLDLEGITWLEEFLSRAHLTVVLITHDRSFLQNMATRIIELNPRFKGGYLESKGDYTSYLLHKEAFLNAQERTERALAGKVRRELDWLRRSPKARTTKSTARVKEAERLIDDLSDIKQRNQDRRSQMGFSATERETRELLTLKSVEKTLGEKKLFSSLDLVLGPGRRLGILGWNGSGKTTLLRILSGDLNPDSGRVKRAEGLRVVYFDQKRQSLDPNMTLKEALCPRGDTVYFRDRQYHVAGWAQRFLFPRYRLEQPVGYLSGGEQARILIARLMLEEADILLLDEPSNDLDIPTLETLEESLMDFPGAIVLVSHDRYLMDRVCNQMLALDGNGGTDVYADFDQWYSREIEKAKENKPIKNTPKPKSTAPKRSGKLTYKEKVEWEGMELKIQNKEEELENLRQEVEEKASKVEAQELQKICSKMHSAEKDLELLYERWTELEEKQRTS